MHQLWNHLPTEEGKEKSLNSVQIDIARLLPAELGYYTFAGSLTTPPCIENVTWFVLKHPVAISNSEIEQFSKMYQHNARPVQPLYDRIVQESK